MMWALFFFRRLSREFDEVIPSRNNHVAWTPRTKYFRRCLNTRISYKKRGTRYVEEVMYVSKT